MSNEITEKEYWSDVEAIAESVIQREHEGEDRYDALHEEVDGSQWIIYYYRAGKCLQFSSNEDAIFDDMGDEAFKGCASMGEIHTRAAYYAMRRDVEEYIDRNEAEIKAKLGIKDDDDDDTEEAEEEAATA
jgi:hypothetical protein